MRRRWTIIIVVTLLSLTAVSLIVYWRHTVPSDRCSDIFRHYAHTAGVQAAFIAAFEVNDSLAVDVTTLTATDSAGWAQLVADFNVPRQHDGNLLDVSSRLAPRGRYHQSADKVLANNDLVVSSAQKHTVVVMHVESEQQLFDLMLYKNRKLKESQTS